MGPVRALDEAVIAYLERSNRPHSEKELWENMHKPTSCAKLKAILIRLGGTGALRHYVNGKFNVFWADQDQYDDECGLDNIKALEAEAEETRLRVNELMQTQSELNSAVNALKSRPVLSDLEKQLHDVSEQLALGEAKVSAINASAGGAVDPKAREKLIKVGQSYLKTWKSRSEKVKDVLGDFSEGSGKTLKKCAEDMDLEMAGDGVTYKGLKAQFVLLTKG